jgi:hypothetical protein
MSPSRNGNWLLSRKTAGKVREALRKFSLPKDGRHWRPWSESEDREYSCIQVGQSGLSTISRPDVCAVGSVTQRGTTPGTQEKQAVPSPMHYFGTSANSRPAAMTKPKRERRHLINQSHKPTVASAECKLEQPKPVRGSDMRRLVSLCKDKVSKYRPRGEV